MGSLKNKKIWQPSSVWDSTLYQDPSSSKRIKVYEIVTEIEAHNIMGNKTLMEAGKFISELKRVGKDHPYLSQFRIITHHYHDGRDSQHEHYLVGTRSETKEEFDERQFSIQTKAWAADKKP